MGITERKEREKEEMRRKILDAARKLFLEQGFEKTSVRNIADVIEYSPATIYLYYQDKNALLFALHEEAFVKMVSELAAVASVKEPFDRLVEMGRQYIKFAIENPELYDLMFIMSAPMETLACRNEIWDDGIRAFNMMEVIVQQCIDNKIFRQDIDVRNASLTIWAYMHGLLAIYLKNRLGMFEDDEPIKHVYQSYELFIKMLKEGLAVKN